MTPLKDVSPDAMAVIFDMDGVLVDSYRPHLASWRRAAGRFGLTMSEADFAGTFGRTSREIIRKLWPDRFAEADEPAAGGAPTRPTLANFDRLKESDYRDIISETFPAMDGAAELIAALFAAKFKLAIGSSGPAENVALVKRKLPNGDLISETVDGSQVKHGKPDPEVFLLAARKLGVAPARCAVVEDAIVGLQAARSAGMTAIALTGTADRAGLTAHADLVVDSLRELSSAIIESLIFRRARIKL
jgi:beta-phosphoglucomutase